MDPEIWKLNVSSEKVSAVAGTKFSETSYLERLPPQVFVCDKIEASR